MSQNLRKLSKLKPEHAGTVRRIRTPEGARKYGGSIGQPIKATKSATSAAKRATTAASTPRRAPRPAPYRVGRLRGVQFHDGNGNYVSAGKLTAQQKLTHYRAILNRATGLDSDGGPRFPHKDDERALGVLDRDPDLARHSKRIDRMWADVVDKHTKTKTTTKRAPTKKPPAVTKAPAKKPPAVTKAPAKKPPAVTKAPAKKAAPEEKKPEKAAEPKRTPAEEISQLPFKIHVPDDFTDEQYRNVWNQLRDIPEGARQILGKGGVELHFGETATATKGWSKLGVPDDQTTADGRTLDTTSFFSPYSNQVFIVGDHWREHGMSVIAHELGHALDWNTLIKNPAMVDHDGKRVAVALIREDPAIVDAHTKFIFGNAKIDPYFRTGSGGNAISGQSEWVAEMYAAFVFDRKLQALPEGSFGRTLIGRDALRISGGSQVAVEAMKSAFERYGVL